MAKGWNYRIFRKWALFLGGFVGFLVVLIVDLLSDREVNYAIYVLLAGMMGLDSVLTRQEEHDREERSDRGPPKEDNPDVDVKGKDDPP